MYKGVAAIVSCLFLKIIFLLVPIIIKSCHGSQQENRGVQPNIENHFLSENHCQHHANVVLKLFTSCDSLKHPPPPL